MKEMQEYRRQIERVVFCPDFEQRTAELMRQAAGEKENFTMRNRKSVKIIIAAAAAAILLTTTVFAVSTLLSAGDVAQQLGDRNFITAFESEDAVSINQTAVVGDYELTLLGIASGEQLDFINDQAIENFHSYVVLAAKRTDGAPIDPADGLKYGDTGREYAISPLVDGWAPHMVNAWSLNCCGHGLTIDGVRYYLFDYTNLELFADRTVYLAVYEGLAPSIEKFTLHEDGTITFAEGYTGEGTMFTLPVDPSKADREAAMELLENMGVLDDTGLPADDAEIITEEEIIVEIDENGKAEVICGDADVLIDGVTVEIIDEVESLTTTTVTCEGEHTPTTATAP